jgi:outer membrane protein TolC
MFSFALVEGVKVLRQEYAAGQVGLERARLQMEQGVRKMYNNILLIEANAALLDESFRNTQRQAELAEASFRAGLAPRLAWTQAQVAVQNLRPAVNDVQNTLVSIKGNFALMLGMPFDASFELEPVALDIVYIQTDVADLISRAAANKPDIQALRASIASLQAQRRALRVQTYTPFLRFGWTVSSMFNTALDPFKESWSDGNNWVNAGQAGGSFSVTLGMNFNGLFRFTAEGQRLRDTDAALQMQTLHLTQTIHETELEIFTKINSLNNILTTVEVQQATVELAGESYRLTEEAFRSGLQDLQVMQSAALALDQARLQLVREQFNFLNDLIDLEYALGIPFGTLSANGSLE